MKDKKVIYREVGLFEWQWEVIESYMKKRGYRSLSQALREIIDVFLTSSTP